MKYPLLGMALAAATAFSGTIPKTRLAAKGLQAGKPEVWTSQGSVWLKHPPLHPHDFRNPSGSKPFQAGFAAAADTFVTTQFNVDAWTGTVWANDSQTLYTVNSQGWQTGSKGQLWLSAAWKNNDSTGTTRDSKGRVLSTVIQFFDDSGAVPSNYVRFLSTYVGDTLQVMLTQPWNSTAGNWVDYERDSIRTNASGQRLSVVVQGWVGGNWVTFNRYSTSYNAKEKPILYLTEEWVPSLRVWAPLFKDTLLYDSADRFARQWGLDMDLNGNWVNAINILAAYAGVDAKPSDITFQYWDTGSVWTSDHREVHTYDSRDYDSVMVVQVWDGLQWLATLRALSAVDSNGNPTEVVRQLWSSGDGTWTNSQRGRWAWGRFSPSSLKPGLLRPPGSMKISKTGEGYRFMGIKGVAQIEIRDVGGRLLKVLPVVDGAALWRVQGAPIGWVVFPH